MKKILLIILVILIVGGLGYGFYGGIKTKAFAQKSQDLLTASGSKWQVDKLTAADELASAQEAQTFYTNVKDDSTQALSEIQNQGSTLKARDLKKNTERFYTLAQKAGENGLTLSQYVVLMEQIGKDISNFNINATGMEQLKTQLEQYKKAVDKDLDQAKQVKTTPSIEEINKQLISALTDISNALGEAIVAAQANQPEKVTEVMNNLSNTMKKYTNFNMPDENEVKNDILTSSEQTEMKDLSTKIKDEVSLLKNTIFAF